MRPCSSLVFSFLCPYGRGSLLLSFGSYVHINSYPQYNHTHTCILFYRNRLLNFSSSDLDLLFVFSGRQVLNQNSKEAFRVESSLSKRPHNGARLQLLSPLARAPITWNPKKKFPAKPPPTSSPTSLPTSNFQHTHCIFLSLTRRRRGRSHRQDATLSNTHNEK